MQGGQPLSYSISLDNWTVGLYVAVLSTSTSVKVAWLMKAQRLPYSSKSRYTCPEMSHVQKWQKPCRFNWIISQNQGRIHILLMLLLIMVTMGWLAKMNGPTFCGLYLHRLWMKGLWVQLIPQNTRNTPKLWLMQFIWGFWLCSKRSLRIFYSVLTSQYC